MRIRSRLVAALGVAALSLGGVTAAVTAASAAEPDAILTIETQVVVEGDDWGGGIWFSSSGWTPSAQVDFMVSRIDSSGASETWTTQFAASGAGNVDGSLVPEGFSPQAPGADGYPQYEVFAWERDAGGASIRMSNTGYVTVLPPAPEPPDEPIGDPTLNVHQTTWEPAADWGAGITFDGSNWTPGAEVTVTLTKEDEGSIEPWSQAFVAGDDGGISGTLTPPASLAPQPAVDGHPAYRVSAFEGSTERSSNTVELVVQEPTPPGGQAIGLPQTTFEAGDDWGDGIRVTGVNWDPAGPVTIYLIQETGEDSRERWSQTVTPDSSGAFETVLHPAIPPQTEGLDGYPSYFVFAEQLVGGGLARSPEHRLTITEPSTQPVGDPVLSVTRTVYQAGTNWDSSPIAFTGTDWTPGAAVTVTLHKAVAEGDVAEWSEEFVAGTDGRITGGLTPSAQFAPEVPSDGYPSYWMTAFEAQTERQSNEVGLEVLPATPIGQHTFTVPNRTFEAGDTWGDGIAVSGLGWSSDAPVVVTLIKRTADAEERWADTFTPANGLFSGTIQPEIAPEAPGSDGYPEYVLVAQQTAGPDLIRSGEIPLTITAPEEPPVFTPVIVVDPVYTLPELEEGILLPFGGFKPGENVQFQLGAFFGPETRFAELLVPADGEGGGALTVTADGSTGEFALDPAQWSALLLSEVQTLDASVFDQDIQVTLTAIGGESDATTQVTFMIDVPGVPTPPDSGDGTADASDGQLPTTGADQAVTASAGGFAAGILLFGLALLAIGHRRVARAVRR